MKKNLIAITLVIVASMLMTIFVLKGDEWYQIFEDKMTTLIADWRLHLDVKKYQKKGYVVLKDGSLWYLLKEENEKVTLLSANTINEKGNQSKEDYQRPFDQNCGNHCSLNYSKDNTTNVFYFVTKKFFEPTINNIKDPDLQSITMRLVTADDLKEVGCDIEKMDCSKAPDWLTKQEFWTSIIDYEKGEIWAVTKDKKIVSKKAYEETSGIRPVLITSRKNIYE